MTPLTFFLIALLTFISALTIYTSYPEYEYLVLLTLPIIGMIVYISNLLTNLILKKLWHWKLLIKIGKNYRKFQNLIIHIWIYHQNIFCSLLRQLSFWQCCNAWLICESIVIYNHRASLCNSVTWKLKRSDGEAKLLSAHIRPPPTAI